MVETQIERRGIKDAEVLSALKKVKRHLFIDPDARQFAYNDHPLSIGYKQTISQPFIVAYMSEAAKLKKGDRVLEIGTGSGYQAAVLGEIAGEVYTIEIIKDLAISSKKRLKDLGYKNIFVIHGDGYQGMPDNAPFDAIVVTAAPLAIPERLVEQLKVGGRMIIPVGDFSQELLRITRTENGFQKEKLLPVRFVPMVRDE